MIDPSAYRPEQIDLVLSVLKTFPEHYTFISTISVYRSFPPGLQHNEDSELLPGGDSYGALKARTEAAIQAAMPGRVAILRSGLIAGPYDPTGRFTYWLHRIDAGGCVLAPGRRERPIQFIDARDLAQWSVRMAEEQIGAVLNAVGPKLTLTMRSFLDQCLEASNRDVELQWLTDEQIQAADIQGWTELPLWIAEGDTDVGGIFHADNRRAMEQGLMFRPLVETIRDTLDWSRATGEVKPSPLLVQTLSPGKERATLARFDGV